MGKEVDQEEEEEGLGKGKKNKEKKRRKRSNHRRKRIWSQWCVVNQSTTDKWENFYREASTTGGFWIIRSGIPITKHCSRFVS